MTGKCDNLSQVFTGPTLITDFRKLNCLSSFNVRNYHYWIIVIILRNYFHFAPTLGGRVSPSPSPKITALIVIFIVMMSGGEGDGKASWGIKTGTGRMKLDKGNRKGTIRKGCER